MVIWHFNVWSFLLINVRYKPISLQDSSLSVEQPIRIDWVMYKHHWEFQINKEDNSNVNMPYNWNVGIYLSWGEYDESVVARAPQYQECLHVPKLLKLMLILTQNICLMEHVNEYPTMHFFGIPRHAQSTIAKILTDYSSKFKRKNALWECC